MLDKNDVFRHMKVGDVCVHRFAIRGPSCPAGWTMEIAYKYRKTRDGACGEKVTYGYEAFNSKVRLVGLGEFELIKRAWELSKGKQ